MSNNTFFKPTPLYKEFMILDLIEKNKDITQREIAENVGMAVSLVNNYIKDYESKGYLYFKHHSKKTIEYFVTQKGKERKKNLNILYLNESQKIYKSAKKNIILFFRTIYEKGFKKILLYGAGEVAELILDVLAFDNESKLKVLAIIDDDINKIGKFISSTKIISRNDLPNYDGDGILISTMFDRDKILKNILEINYDKSKIISI